MRAEIKEITPEFAKELLKMNIGNRRLKFIKEAYVAQMKSGRWKENGEPIIIDINGLIKDGQHRLNAVIEANFSYICPIIYDVDPNVMDTIDTGSNRSLTDVLQLNDIMYYSDMSSLIKGIHASKIKGLASGFGHSTNIYRGGKHLSNGEGLEFAMKNKEGLIELIKTSERIYNKTVIKTLTKKEIGIVLYVLAEYNPTEKHIEFIKKITGAIIDDKSITSWLYKKLLSSKLNKHTLKYEWKTEAIIKVWNAFVSGDEHAIKFIRVDPSISTKPTKIDK
jgi:hypothetical protein